MSKRYNERQTPPHHEARRLADRLRKRRHDLGLTQQDIAMMAGMNPVTISLIELGKTEVKIGTLARILPAYKLNLSLTEHISE